MKVLVMGNGLIGKACVEAYIAYGHDVLAYDADPLRSQVHDSELKFALESADYVVCVVPTPPAPSGGFDLQYLRSCVKLFKEQANPKAIFVQRSTTLPGDAIELADGIEDRYVMSPSFAYRNSAAKNETNPVKIVIGAETFELARKVATELYSKKDTIYLGTLAEAELSKVASNLWQGLIISAWNELKLTYRTLDNDFVMETLVQEHNLHSIKRFHGKAFGKGGRLDDDMRAFALSENCLKDNSIFEAALFINDALRQLKGEENRPTSELEALAFKGFVSRSFGEGLCQ